MTTAKLYPGACGMEVLINVSTLENDIIKLEMFSECEMVVNMNKELNEFNWKKGVFGKILDSQIYQISSRYLKHVDCPVPSAILKAIQVEVGAAVDQEVILKVKKES